MLVYNVEIMADYRERIQDRASIVNVILNNDQLTILNQQVNDRINSGLHEFDALDYAYFYIKNNHVHNVGNVDCMVSGG